MQKRIISLSILILAAAALAALPASYSQATFTVSSIATTITVPGVTTVTLSSIATTVTVNGVTTVTISSIPNTIVVSATTQSATSSTTTSSTTSSSTTSSSTTTSTSSTASSVATPDFTLASTPPSLSVAQGTSGMTTIDVSSLNSFSSPVSLTYSWIGTAPSGVSISLTSPVTPTATPATSPLTVSASTSATIGSFTLGVTGTSGALSHTLNVGITVTAPVTTTSTSGTSSAAPGPVCLIATATYGSQMAPEVQLLRNFRDQSVMRSRAGSSFMVLFNSWYYSFSPNVAAYISGHLMVRTAMKAVLYPLVGILFLTSNLYTATSSYPELGILLSGLLASGLIGAFYIGLPLSLLRRVTRKYRRSAVAERYLTFILIAGIGVLAAGEFLYSPVLMMISTAMIVLSTLTLSAFVTSRKIAERL